MTQRFVYVCADPGIPIPGTKGASIHVQSVIEQLVRMGYAGEICAVRPEAETLGGVPVRKIELPIRRKRKSVEEREARLFLGSLNSLIAAHDKPNFIYERYTLWHAGGLARARELDVPFILEVNSPLPEEAKKFRGLANEPLAEGLARLLLREADGIVCVSEEVAAWVAGHRGHDGGVWVVPNGVDPERFAPCHERPDELPADSPLVGFCGSFRPWHGLDELLDAFQIVVEERVPEAHLVCVGDGPQRSSFEDSAQRRGIGDRVHITGQLPQSEVAHWIGDADVAVAPYPDLDHFYFSPLKIFEFLALGLPVVSARVGQIPDLVPHARRGYLYSPGDERGLADAMSHLLEDRDEARRIADAGHQWVLENATWEKRVEEILRRIGELS